MIPCVHGHAGKPFTVKGNAYDFGRAISAVQFSLDEGKHWTTYRTEGTNDYQNLTWSLNLTLDAPGTYRLVIRSVNDRGEASPTPAYVDMEID